MLIELDGSLVFTTVGLTYRGRTAAVSRVLIDCGSESTILAVDSVEALGIQYELGDRIETIRGVGGREFVFTRSIDNLTVGEMAMANFMVEFGGMDYGFPINGVLGMDFLLPSRAVVDFGSLEIRFPCPIR